MNKDIKNNEAERRKMFTLFILFFPSILVGIIPESINQTIWIPLSLKVLLIFYQFVVLKNFVDKHYNE